MKTRISFIYRLSVMLLVLVVTACSNPTPKDNTNSQAPQVLKKNSPLDEQKIKKSNAMMLDIYNQMSFIPDMDHFLNLVNHFKKNHLFANADSEGYIIVGVSNKGFQQVPEGERFKLIDTSTMNNGYQLNFLLHHIFICPKKVYSGMTYRSLSGDEVSISDRRFDMYFKEKRYPILSSLKFSDQLEIIAVDSVLFR